MSFWNNKPGPTWWDCIESLNPCVQSPYGLCDKNLLLRPHFFTLSRAFHCVSLAERHAHDIEIFLKEHFTIYPRCRISLSKERIYQGFLYDKWIGVGIYTMDKKIIGCCISKPLGRMKFEHELIEEGGVVDYFCVHKNYRKLGLAEYMLEELIQLTAKQKRLVHIFLKEGFPLLSLPPLYHGQYIVRERRQAGEGKEHLGSLGIGLRGLVQNYSHQDFLPLTKFVANLPWQLTGDSELFSFTFKGHRVFLCLTNLHHRTVPEGKTLGELSWILPQTIEVPLSIQRQAVEMCVNCSSYDYVLMDSKIPHEKQGWKKDAPYSWYIFNYNPGAYFSVKPFWIF